MNLNIIIKNLIGKKCTILFALCIFLKLSFAQTPTLPPYFTDQLISSTWSQPLGIIFDANNQCYVWEKAGYLWKIDSNGVKAATPILDIRNEVGNWVDHGMNGLALDPNYLTNGYIYCYYAVDRHYLLNFGTPAYKPGKNEYSNATIARVVRFQVDINDGFNSIVPNSRYILIGDNKKNGITITHTSHSGGAILFGTDGSLLVSTGDGASFNGVDSGSSLNSYALQALADTMITPRENVGAFKSQLLESLSGKILRIDPITGLGLPSNPYYEPSNPNSIRSKVWCLGLRNPFRITLTPGTGSTDITAGNPGVLVIGDVGWFNYEEVNISKVGGENFGWPIYEGLTLQADYSTKLVCNYDAVNPLYDTISCNKQFFYFKDLIKQETLDTTINFKNPCDTNQLIENYPTFFHTRPQIDYKHYQAITRTGIFIDNVANISVIGSVGSPVEGVQFAGNAALGGTWYTDNRIPPEFQGQYYHLDYGSQWIKRLSFNNDYKLTKVDSFYTNMNKATFLCVNPNDGCFNYISYLTNELRKICYSEYINNPPVAVISVDSQYGQSPLQVVFNGSKSFDNETKVNLSYLWKFGDGYSSTGKIAGHVYNIPSGDPTTIWATLKVTDSLGLSMTDSILISINNTPPTVNITSIRDSDYYATSYQSFVDLQAEVLDAEQVDSTLTYEWQVTLFHNNHYHPGPIDTDKITNAIIDPEGCDGDFFYFSVSLKVTDPLGLWSTDTVKLFPACSKPEAKFDTTAKSICIGDSIQFTDSSNVVSNRKWYFPGGTPDSSTLSAPLVYYNTPGIYAVKLVVTNPEGADSITNFNLVNVSDNTISLGATFDSICNKSFTNLSTTAAVGSTYEWYRNTVKINNITSSSYSTNIAADYAVKVQSPAGCMSIATKTIYQKSISAVISADKPLFLCYLDTITFASNSIGPYSYQWKRNSKVIIGATNPSYSTIIQGLYFIETTNNGCIGKSNKIDVKTNPNFVMSLSGSLSFCIGDSVIISATNPGGANTFQWKKDGNLIPDATTKSLTIYEPGRYVLIVTGADSCVKTSQAYKVIVDCKFLDTDISKYIDQVSIQPNPVVDVLNLTFSLVTESNLIVNIYDLTGRIVYSKTDLGTELGDNSFELNVSALTIGIYQLEVTDTNGNFKSMNRFVKSK